MRTALVPGAHTGPFTGKITGAVSFCAFYLAGVSKTSPDYTISEWR